MPSRGSSCQPSWLSSISPQSVSNFISRMASQRSSQPSSRFFSQPSSRFSSQPLRSALKSSVNPTTNTTNTSNTTPPSSVPCTETEVDIYSLQTIFSNPNAYDPEVARSSFNNDSFRSFVSSFYDETATPSRMTSSYKTSLPNSWVEHFIDKRTKRWTEYNGMSDAQRLKTWNDMRSSLKTTLPSWAWKSNAESSLQPPSSTTPPSSQPPSQTFTQPSSYAPSRPPSQTTGRYKSTMDESKGIIDYVRSYTGSGCPLQGKDARTWMAYYDVYGRQGITPNDVDAIMRITGCRWSNAITHQTMKDTIASCNNTN
nr:hypothetical protein L204_03225 [Cryptococcus depauperatus CBS 7855]